MESGGTEFVAADEDDEEEDQGEAETKAGLLPPSENRESRGWKWLVLLLAVGISSDKLGLLDNQANLLRIWASVPFPEAGTLLESSLPTVLTPQLPVVAVLPTHPAGRLLSSSETETETETDSEEGHEEEHEHESHPHEAMFFLVSSILVSAMILHLAMKVPGLQQTVLLFILGFAASLFIQLTDLEDKLGPLGRSYVMWMNINPHLLLFTLLPPLLAGDAMGIDINIAKRVANQCLYLAGPGVLINGFITAGFLVLYMNLVGDNWSFLLCMTLGSILCATDPVAVVALLKELGASPTLTIQIQGESLLNDGTAIVLYTVSYNMLKGESFDLSDIIVFLVKTALYAWLLGMIIGGFFYLWIKVAKNKLNHNSSIVQVSLTIACAYSSFIVAEGIFSVSGVLSTVAASLVLAWKMWPEVVSQEAMHTIWHIFEFLGNTIIFFLAGALTGSIFPRIPWVDFVHLIVIYIVLTIVRFGMVMLSRPILKYLHSDKKPVSAQDAMVMSWGGLRGAVGLALAIQVSINRADGKISESDSDKVLFYVGGIALLTLVINATTCPMLVNSLGITTTPEVKVELMMMLNNQLEDVLESENHIPHVKCAVRNVLEEMRHHLNEKAMSKMSRGLRKTAKRASLAVTGGGDRGGGGGGGTASGRLLGVGGGGGGMAAVTSQKTSSRRRTSVATIERSHVLQKVALKLSSNVTSADVVKALVEAKARFEKLEFTRKEHIAAMISQNVAHTHFEELKALVDEEDQEFDSSLLRALIEAFLALVRTQYWVRIGSHDLHTAQGQMLLDSVTSALSTPSLDLEDFQYLLPQMVETEADDEAARRALQNNGGPVVAGMDSSAVVELKSSAQTTTATNQKPALESFLDGNMFQAVVMTTIVVSSIFTFADSEKSSSNMNDLSISSVVEILAICVFSVEAVLKLTAYKVRYFFDSWNVFDFVLVILGIVTIIIGFAQPENATGGGSASVARSLKVFRILRAMRLVRLIKIAQNIVANIFGQSIDEVTAERMRNIDVLVNFIAAHSEAQKGMVTYFGSGTKINSPEIARVILQSQKAVYTAMSMLTRLEGCVPGWMLDEEHICHSGCAAGTELEKFICNARDLGVLTGSEAETLIHTLHQHMENFYKRVSALQNGRVSKPIYVQCEESEEAAADQKEATTTTTTKGGDSLGLQKKEDESQPFLKSDSPTSPSPSPSPNILGAGQEGSEGQIKVKRSSDDVHDVHLEILEKPSDIPAKSPEDNDMSSPASHNLENPQDAPQVEDGHKGKAIKVKTASSGASSRSKKSTKSPPSAR